MKDEIVWLPISSLMPYEHNAKEHTETQINNLVKSFDEFGWVMPCLIDGDNNIVVGHGRIEAAKRLGYEKAKCLIADDMTDEQIKKYRHLDNLLSEGNYIQSEFDIDMPDLGDFDFSELELNVDLSYDIEPNFDYDIPEKGESTYTEVQERFCTCPSCGLRFVPEYDG